MFEGQSVELSYDILELCKHFAERSVGSSLAQYGKRKQFNKQKIIDDIYNGKVGEFGVYFLYLRNSITGITAPDINLYIGKHKSFDADLRHGMFQLHIKTQHVHSVKAYGNSWVFQKEDPVVSSPNEYDVFIGTTIYGNTVTVVLHKLVSSLKFAPPKLKSLTSKTCIYLEDNI